MAPNPEFANGEMAQESSFINQGYVPEEKTAPASGNLESVKLSGKSLGSGEKVDDSKSLSISNNNSNNNNNNNSKSEKGGDEDLMDFDDLLPHIGEFGRYQKILFLLMIPFAFFVAFVYFSQIFMTLVPEKHYCSIPELEQLLDDPNDRLVLLNRPNDYSLYFRKYFAETRFF